ncbi:MAG: DUF1289 domain-containing protein [Gammaproteobacteria bacterium]|nr:DUF1289 domain-containing protein [Gammaproteobacteria bacterium]
MKFTPCQDRCTHEGSHCQGCGRSHEEIGATKQMVDAIVAYALQMGYENVEEFTQYIGNKSLKKYHKALALRD